LGGQVFARILRQPEALACLNASLETKQLEICQLVLKVPTSRIYQGSAAPIGDHVLFTLLDISAQLDAEKARSTFVANVSHELRSPLTAVAGIVETLQGPARHDEKARDRFLDLMQGETERMSRLVGDLLSLSKLESKEHVLPTERVNLIKTITRVIDVLSAATPTYKGRVRLQEPEAPLFVIGDHDELTEVFQNLIENALKYSPPASDVVVDLSLETMPAPQIIAQITDQGDGIAKEHLPRLTERFYRVDKGRSREMGGTGLGLAITKHILNRHRAKLTVDSEVGHGTTMSVVFTQLEGPE
jgi:two-component system phosphate regulon sensor histidine kinase PhoR